MKFNKCKKKKFSKSEALGYLKNLKEKIYSKKPWRTEVSYYKCDKCNLYHVSSKLESASNTIIQNKNYFDFQKENWGAWLQSRSAKKGNI